MQTTTDTSLAAFLIDSGITLIDIDYSQDKWEYQFDMTEEEHEDAIQMHRQAHISNILKIHNALTKAGKGYVIEPYVTKQWPCLDIANLARERKEAL